MIRLAIPSIDDSDLDAVRDAIASGFLVQGPRVAAFERAVAEAVGCRHAVAVANCTCALHLALLALDVRPGDICVVTAYSWVSTANVIELCGARPVFVDIDPRTFNIDPAKLESVLEELMANEETARRVKAVLPVDAFGQLADYREINRICRKWDLPVIEDAACALGASLDGRMAGNWTAMGCFSFHPRKAITTGEGGMITTNDDRLLRRLCALRNHGLDPDASAPDFIMPGHNYRLTEFQAAFGCAQMAKMERIIAARRAGASVYDRLLAGSPLTAPVVPPGSAHVYQSYVTLLPHGSAPLRKDLIVRCREAGVEVQVGTIHMPLTSYYRSRYGFRVGDFPGADEVGGRTLTLPLYESITPEDQQKAVQTVLANL